MVTEEEEAEDTSSTSHFYSNGQKAPEEMNLYDLEYLDLMDRLKEIVNYIRVTHYYCIWCGSAFDSIDELNQQCPGRTREDHDNDGD